MRDLPHREFFMAAAATEADRIRVSDDMVGATSGLVAAMLRSKMVSKEALPGIVRDIHSALIDISLQSVSLVEQLDAIGDITPRARTERRPVSSESISRTVSRLLDMSTTEVEPAIPHQVRVPPSPAPRPVVARTPASPAEAPAPQKPSPPAAPKAAEPVVAKAPAVVAPAKPAPTARLKPQTPPVVQPSLPFEPPASKGKAADKPSEPWTGEERRARPIKAKTVIEPSLPPRLTSIEEALNLDFIVCLEDGRKVKDLREHLAKLKITPDQYRAKWKLPAEYPMVAPALLIKRADRRVDTYEVDLVTGKIRKAR